MSKAFEFDFFLQAQRKCPTTSKTAARLTKKRKRGSKEKGHVEEITNSEA